MSGGKGLHEIGVLGRGEGIGLGVSGYQGFGAPMTE